MAELLTRAEIATILDISDETDIPQEVVDWGVDQVEKSLHKNYGTVDTDEEFFFTRAEDLQMALYLKYINVTVTKVERRGLDESEWTALETDTYYTDSELGVVLFTITLNLTTRYKVTYSYGGDSATNLEKKLHFLFVLDYLQKYKSDILGTASNGSSDVKKEVIGDYSIEYAVASTASSAQTKVERDIQDLIATLGGNFGDYENTEIL